MRFSAKALLLIFFLSSSTLLNPISALASSQSVTAVVPANATSFAAIMTSDTSGTVGQDQVITYTLTYGSTLNTSTPITLDASWSRGTIEGSGAQADVLTYVPNSAADAYGSTPAIIDSVNQKITWNISSFDANVTNQQVTFKLKTSNTLTSDPKINVTIAGDLKGPGFTTTPSTVSNSFSTYSVPKPTNTPAPTPTPTASPVKSTPTPVIPVPTNIPAPILSDVSVRTVAADSATIAVTSSSPTSINISYGESINALSSIATDNITTSQHLLSLTKLKPGTTYFFLVSDNSRQSDIYTFTTALPGDVPAPLLPSLVITSGNTVLTTPLKNTSISSPSNNLMLPTGTFYEFRISIPNATTIKRVQAVLRNATILAAATSGTDDGTTTSLDLIEISPGIFTGRLITPTQPGKYLLILKISDVKGNIVEQKIADINVSNPFTIQDELGKPIESARVKLWYFDERSKKFFYLDPQSTSITNPTFSSSDGHVTVALPQGKYKAEISNLRYQTQIVTFSVGNSPEDSYPTVKLKYAPFNLTTTVIYYVTTLNEIFFQQTHSYFASLSASRRMVDLMSAVIMASFVVLLIFSFAMRIQLSVLMLPKYLLYLYRRLFTESNTPHSLQGKIVNAETDKSLNGVTVYARNETSDQIINHAVTDNSGRFSLRNLPPANYSISFVKIGFRPFVLQNISPALVKQDLNIGLSVHPRHITLGLTFIHSIKSLLGLGFETILILSFVLSLTIGFNWGFREVLPYIGLSLFNLTTWLLHRRYQPVKHS